MRTSFLKRTLSAFLCLVMCLTMLPAQVFAEELSEARQASVVPQGEQPDAIRTADGEISVDEDWTGTYAFGTFAFGNHQADVAEPGALTNDGQALPQSVLIPVYRLGGTTGRVTVRIVYAPAVTTTDGADSLYEYAASGRRDLRIEYENPNPIAAYQTVGLPQAVREMQPAPVSVVMDADPSEAEPEGELQLRLSEQVRADSFRWQVLQNGRWQDIADSGDAALTVRWSDLWDFEAEALCGMDFRCILSENGTLSCAQSLLGAVYEPIAPPEPVPEDLDPEADPGFSVIEMAEDFDLYEFSLTFADGETVKYLRVTALDDELPELPELGLFTITGCEGGELCDTCPSLTLMVSDNDPGEPSELGFAASSLTVDRAEQAAKVRVTRSGGKTYSVSVRYQTVDGTAKAGVDYAKAEGELAFVGSVDELEIPIELIAGGATEDRSFDILLTELRGGGTEELCRLNTERITITLTGASPSPAADGSGQNLATLLSGADGEDVSDRVSTGDEALLGSGQTPALQQTTIMPDSEPLRAVRSETKPTRSHLVTPSFSFTRSSNYDETNYWADWELVLGSVPKTVYLSGTDTDLSAGISKDSKNTENYSGRTISGSGSSAEIVYENLTITQTNPPSGSVVQTQELQNFATVVKDPASDTQSTNLVFPEVFQFNANWNAKASLRFGQYVGSETDKIGNLFSGYQFVYNVPSIGGKVTGNAIIGRKLFLLVPLAEFSQGKRISDGVDQILNPITEDFNVTGQTQYYYYLSSFYDASSTPTKYTWGYPENRDGNYWRGPSYVNEIPISFDADTATAEIDLAMHQNGALDGAGVGETCSDGARTYVNVLNYSLRRREFTNTHAPTSNSDTSGISLMVYTANDADEVNGSSATPVTDLGFYNSILPNISLSYGGVSSTGNIYVGSVITIRNTLASQYYIHDQGVFVTNSKGERVGTVKAHQVNGATEWTIEMYWDDMNQEDLDEHYQINIFVQRTQSFKVNVIPSTPQDAEGNVAAGAYDNAIAAFANKAKPTVTYRLLSKDTAGYPTPISSGSSLYYSTCTEDLTDFRYNQTDSAGVYKAGCLLYNLQSINFHQDPEDVILYNGRAYAGNDTIWLTQADFSVTEPIFTFYDSDYLTASSPMQVFIDHVEVYYDKDGDGVISGTFEDGVFKLTTVNGETKDDFICQAAGDYPESFFAPYLDKDGHVHQYFFKVYLTLQPRALSAPPGAQNARAQLLPAFLSAATDEESRAGLTEEQKTYRYILANNTDDHPMYGAAATELSYVDIPLGGDVGEKSATTETVGIFNEEHTKIVDSETTTTYTWTPNYTGQLLVPFENPSPIVDEHNITGGAVPIACENPKMNENGTYAWSDAGRSAVNANLGSFSGRTTFAIGVQEQKVRTRATRSEPGINSMDDIQPETISPGTVSSTPAGDDLLHLGTASDNNETEAGAPGQDAGYEEFAPDLGTELPSLQFDLAGYATIIVDGYQIGVSVGIPIFSYEDTDYHDQPETLANGVTKTTYNDYGGVVRETYISENQRTVTEVVTTPDPKDPNKRTKVVETKTTDENGKVTIKKTEKTQEKIGDEWENTSKITTTETPPAPSKAAESVKQGNEKLCDFVSACKSGHFSEVKKFAKGSFQDDSLQNARNGNCTSTKVEASFTVQLAIMFEYNPIDNCHYFKNAGIAASVGLEFTAQHRFSVFPLAYCYLKVGCSLEFALGLSVLRQAKEGPEITSFLQGSLEGLSSGKPAVFALDMRSKPGDPVAGLPADSQTARGFHLDLKGKVYMEVFSNPDCSGEAKASGMLCGDGSQKEVLFEPYGSVVYVRLTPVRGQALSASGLKPVVGATSKVVFDGVTITPSLSLEVGAGLGVEVLKIEIFVRTSVAISITLGGYLEETNDYEFYVSSFEWALAVGFHATLLFIDYAMDVIGIGVEGAQHGTGGYFNWDISASAADGNKVLWEKTTYTAANGSPLPGEPQEPNGINLFRDSADVTFFNADGSKTDLSELPADPQDWSFSTGVSPARWKGGAFSGETPQGGDLSVAVRNGASLSFITDAAEMDLYFSGKITVKSDRTDPASVSYTGSPAKVRFDNPNGDFHTVTILADNGTALDRVEFPQPSRGGDPASDAAPQPQTEPLSLVHVTPPADLSKSQTVVRPSEASRAITPTGTNDFQLSGYNTAGDAKLLIGGLATGYSYKLVQVGEENYVIYPLYLSGKPQLVVSRLVMTGDLAQTTGLVHPLAPDAETPYLLLDDDGFLDLDYDAAAAGDDTLHVLWVTSADADGTSYVVKERTLRFGENASVGTPSRIGPEADRSFRHTPGVSGSDAVWVGCSGTGDAANLAFKAWLKAQNPGLTDPMLESLTVTDGTLASAVYSWATQSRLNSLYGDESTLYSQSGASARLAPGENVENLEVCSVGSDTWILYSTSQTAYFDANADTPVTVSTEKIDENTERGLIRRLYFRVLNSGGFGEARLLQTAIDFDACTDDTLAAARLKDGLYAGSALSVPQADPYYSNFRFLNADIDGSGVQTLALFEMGGNSWLLAQSDAEALLAGTGSVQLTPIFTETTGTEAVIGSDGTNLAVVYTAPVANSMSNAIFAAWWDVNLQTWGSPVILAMRHLQIYEDRIQYDMDPEDAELAYLGKQPTPGGNAGGMDRLTFSDLQISTRSIELGGKTQQQLIVLTQGSLLTMQEQTFVSDSLSDKRFQSLVPNGDPAVSIYAIAFGAGRQAVGEGSLGLADYDFTSGSRLIGEVQFRNTGTAAIRASEDNPMTVRLQVRSGQVDTALAEWKLTESIASGAAVRLTFRSLELPESLPQGAAFLLDISEDTSYFGENAFHAQIPELLTVEARPDLSISDYEISFSAIEGEKVLLDLRAKVGNNGNAPAESVYLQFAYDTGKKDALGEPIYRPVDINGSHLSTSGQEIRTRQGVAQDYGNGVYELRDGSGTGNLSPGMCRTVSGTLAVPKTCFVSEQDFSGLHLRAEVYSDFDSPDYDSGLYSSDHREYNGTDNRAAQTVKHQTIFSVPSRISTALGTTLLLPVSFVSTSASPELVLTEISDGTPGWEPRMGVCYYDPERQVIVAAPNAKAQALLEDGQTPTGILQLEDRSTNTITAITYKVGSMADGVNIYKDDASFSFRDKNGNPVDVDAAASANPAWLFLDKSTDLGWTGGEIGEIPMNTDLILANQDGASVSFETVADTMTLFFMGSVSVRSSVFDVSAERVYSDRAHPLKYSFVKNGQGNETGLRHTVTITASKGTKIDRYAATYKTNTVPNTDPNAPQILWNRSAPDTASLLPGQSVPMTCYILDGSGLQSVVYNGIVLSEATTPKLVKVDDKLWYFDVTFTENGVAGVRAQDLSGNSAGGTFAVDWFNDVLSADAIAAAPAFTREHLRFVDASGSPVDSSKPLNAAPYLHSSYALGDRESSSAYLCESASFSASPLARSTGERWPAAWNGYYQVRIDRTDGTWARAVVPLTTLDLTPPADTLHLEGAGSPDAPYLIGSPADWQELARFVNAGNHNEGFCFLQTADITVTGSDTVGRSGKQFKGSYDGGGHTLTFLANNAPQSCSPFLYAENAAFRNLHIAGTIRTSHKFAAGLCVNASGSILVENCRSSIVIDSSVSGDGTHSGFLGPVPAGSEPRFVGCVFDGQFLGSETTLCAGFVGYARSNVTICDSLYIPEKAETQSTQNFSRWAGGIQITLNNCYYGGPITGGQGKRAWSVTPGDNVVLSAGTGKTWDVSGLTAYPVGLAYGGCLRAGAGEKLTLELGCTLGDNSAGVFTFTASAGTLSKTDKAYEFTVPASDAVISLRTAPKLAGSGTAEDPYRIGSDQDWRILAAYTDFGGQTEGLHFLQTADFGTRTIVGAVTPFSGSYDGGGHALELSYSAIQYGARPYTAPFSRISGAVIENLHITGSMTGAQHASGLVSIVGGSGNLIRNCLVEPEITLTGTHGGGIVGHGTSAETTIEGCVFAGSIYGGAHVGAIWGWSDSGSSVTIRNCLERGIKYTGSGFNPVGLGFVSARTVANVFYCNPQIGAPGRSWSGFGNRAYRMIPGENVVLNCGTADPSYRVSEIEVFSFGLKCAGILYTEKGTPVTVTPGWTGEAPENIEAYLFSAGEPTVSGGTYSMTMPEQDVTVTAAFHSWDEPSYVWSADNSTVTATVVCRNDPAHILTETAGTTFVLTKPSTFETTGTGYFTAVFQYSVFAAQRKDVIVPEAACAGGDACPSVAFTDMPPLSSYMHIPIDWAVLNQITFGTSARTFGPEDSCTRAQFVTFLWRVRGQPEPETDNNPFTDVKPTAYYYKPVLWAVEQGVTAGTSPTTFSPNSKVTRAQVVTFLWRYEGSPEPTSSDNPFTDVKPGAYYNAAVRWAVEKQITSGTSKTTFSPNDNCTRAQCVTFLYREFGK